jgi:hypothetical protein
MENFDIVVDHLVYFVATLFVYDKLVYVMVIWYTFPILVYCIKKTSGNPAGHTMYICWKYLQLATTNFWGIRFG